MFRGRWNVRGYAVPIVVIILYISTGHAATILYYSDYQEQTLKYMTLSYLFSLASNQISVMLRRSTSCSEQISGIVLIGTAYPLTFHIPLNIAYQPSCASHGLTHSVEYK